MSVASIRVFLLLKMIKIDHSRNSRISRYTYVQILSSWTRRFFFPYSTRKLIRLSIWWMSHRPRQMRFYELIIINWFLEEETKNRKCIYWFIEAFVHVNSWFYHQTIYCELTVSNVFIFFWFGYRLIEIFILAEQKIKSSRLTAGIDSNSEYYPDSPVLSKHLRGFSRPLWLHLIRNRNSWQSRADYISLWIFDMR